MPDNGMVAPFVNATITGAIWYQGENNLFQCVGGRQQAIGNPSACGHAASNTGYGCFMRSLVEDWRSAWSSTPLSSTSATFPFGIASLAGGTSEGFSSNMAAFRLAQTGGTGLLPTVAWPNTFVAQLYDAGDPGDGAAGAANWHDGSGAYCTARGAAPHTSFFMSWEVSTHVQRLLRACDSRVPPVTSRTATRMSRGRGRCSRAARSREAS